MRNLRFRPTVLSSVIVLSASLWVGCATNKSPRTESPSSDGFQVLDPRQTYNTLDPLQRFQMDRAMRMEGWCDRKE